MPTDFNPLTLRRLVVPLALALALFTAGLVAAQPHDDDEEEGDGNTTWVISPDSDDQRAYLGVRVEEETERREGGARVENVVDDSPAEHAGLEAGDVIVSFAGHPIHGPNALTKRIQTLAPGDSIRIVIVRDGKEQSIDAELGERESLFYFSGDGRQPFVWDSSQFNERMGELQDQMSNLNSRNRFRYAFGGQRPKLGVELVDTTPELRQHLGGSRDSGVLIGKILTGTPAERAGLAVGDLIVSVDDESIADSSELIEALADAEGKSLTIGIVRDGRSRTIEVEIPRQEDDDDVPTGPRARLRTTGDTYAAINIQALREAQRALRAAHRIQRENARHVRSLQREAARDAYRRALRHRGVRGQRWL